MTSIIGVALFSNNHHNDINNKWYFTIVFKIWLKPEAAPVYRNWLISVWIWLGHPQEETIDTRIAQLGYLVLNSGTSHDVFRCPIWQPVPNATRSRCDGGTSGAFLWNPVRDLRIGRSRWMKNVHSPAEGNSLAPETIRNLWGSKSMVKMDGFILEDDQLSHRGRWRPACSLGGQYVMIMDLTGRKNILKTYCSLNPYTIYYIFILVDVSNA